MEEHPMLKRGAIAQAACRMLPQEDCDTHPNCHWTQASKDKNGTERKAHCGMTRIAGEYSKQHIRPSGRVSPKRSAGAKRAATKNAWITFLADYRKTHPETKNMRVGDVAKAAKASGGYTPKGKKQTGGYYDMWGGGCGINPATNFCKTRPGDDDAFCFKGAKRCQKKKGSGAPKGRMTPKRTAALKKAHAGARASNIESWTGLPPLEGMNVEQWGKGQYGGCGDWSGEQYGRGCGINPSTNFCKTRPGDDDAFCFKGAKRCQKKKGSGAPKGRMTPKRTAALKKAHAGARASNIESWTGLPPLEGMNVEQWGKGCGSGYWQKPEQHGGLGWY
eukprot:Pompholyxophrys_sp_v1_NODE_1_length_32789_cov_6.460653.p12 type:complete len:333 gc:universal NODE_1_length_32789_cov_6.460653:22763-23761(+)